MEFSKVTIRLREHGKDIDDESDDVLAKLQGNTLETLKQCLNNPTVLSLKDKNGDISKIKISLKYIPVLMRLDPSESINNMGTVRVDILDAANLPSADRNGKSDPFCVFELDDKEVHKTKVQKKTLHPAWNEVFETKVVSRTAANFVVEVFDWDLGSKVCYSLYLYVNPTNQYLQNLGRFPLQGSYRSDRSGAIYSKSRCPQIDR